MGANQPIKGPEKVTPKWQKNTEKKIQAIRVEPELCRYSISYFQVKNWSLVLLVG